jgi:hypothetical protein
VNVIDCDFRTTVKDCVTRAAAAQAALPAWSAATVHVPAATKVTVDPEMVQTLVGVLVKVTGRPEVAVAVAV